MRTKKQIEDDETRNRDERRRVETNEAMLAREKSRLIFTGTISGSCFRCRGTCAAAGAVVLWRGAFSLDAEDVSVPGRREERGQQLSVCADCVEAVAAVSDTCRAEHGVAKLRVGS